MTGICVRLQQGVFLGFIQEVKKSMFVGITFTNQQQNKPEEHDLSPLPINLLKFKYLLSTESNFTHIKMIFLMKKGCMYLKEPKVSSLLQIV